MITKGDKNKARKRRHFRVRRKVEGTMARPRLNVFRSTKHIYAQLIDDVTGISALLGVREIVGALAMHAVDACLYGMGLLLGIVLLSLLLRDRRYALVIYAILQTAVLGLAAANNPLAWVFALMMAAIVMVVLLRYGLLALVVGAFVFKLCVSFPITTNTEAWYFSNGAFAIALIAAMGIWGLITASRAPVLRPYAKAA